MSEWAVLRQVVLATLEPAAVAGELRSRLGLGRGFGDPELEAFGIADDTMAVGAETYVEVVSPTTADHPMATFLAARGGSAGYLLSVQVSDIEACLRRCEQEGVKATLHHEVQGFHVAQLHPGHMGGSSVELDGLHERGRWFWDVLDVDRPASSKVDDIVAVDVAVDDPALMSARWANVFAADRDSAANTIALGTRTVRFTEKVTTRGITAAHLHTVDRARAGETFQTANMTFRLV